jgi:hypothetical protein
MTALNQSELKQEFSKWKPDLLAELIDRLAGEKSSLRVDIQDVRFTIGDRQYDLAGQVYFNVIRKNGKSGYGAVEAPQEQNGDNVPASDAGRVLISTGDLEVLRITIVGKQLDLDVEDKQFIKRVMNLRNEIASLNSEPQEKKAKKKSDPLAIVRTIADTSKKLGITLTISYKGRRIATVGAEAKPTLLHLVTKTQAVAINNLYTAIQLII